jgi:hypothetical protein
MGAWVYCGKTQSLVITSDFRTKILVPELRTRNQDPVHPTASFGPNYYHLSFHNLEILIVVVDVTP